MFGIEEDRLREILNGIIKIGEVSVIYPDKGTARVVFDDDDSMVSAELKVLHKNTFKNGDYSMPDIGEDVVCLFLPCAPEDGFIIGSFYAGEVKPPETDGNRRTVKFSDDTTVTYDRAAHALKVTMGSGTCNVKCPSITLDGNVNITGTLKVSGATTTAGITDSVDVVASGKSLVNHKHTGNAGAPTSPPL